MEISPLRATSTTGGRSPVGSLDGEEIDPSRSERRAPSAGATTRRRTRTIAVHRTSAWDIGRKVACSPPICRSATGSAERAASGPIPNLKFGPNKNQMSTGATRTAEAGTISSRQGRHSFLNSTASAELSRPVTANSPRRVDSPSNHPASRLRLVHKRSAEPLARSDTSARYQVTSSDESAHGVHGVAGPTGKPGTPDSNHVLAVNSPMKAAGRAMGPSEI